MATTRLILLTLFNAAALMSQSVVVAPPVATATFNPFAITVGGTAVLTFTITDPASNAVALTGVGFNSTLPSGLQVAPGRRDGDLQFGNAFGGHRFLSDLGWPAFRWLPVPHACCR